MLRHYREAVVTTDAARLGQRTVTVAVAYFCVWAVFGIAAFAVGVSLATAEMQRPALARAVPTMAALVVVVGGALQFTRWKAHHLACFCARPVDGRVLPSDVGTAWWHGVGLGLNCAQCCGCLIVILLVVGIMDLRVMLAVGAAITLERVAPSGERVARAIGAASISAGLLLLARALGTLR
jgi:predicted metal-binding membrane protein